MKMIYKHNIKPEVLPIITGVMRTSNQAINVYKNDESFCAVGCVLEAYRRTHPGFYWIGDSLRSDDLSFRETFNLVTEWMKNGPDGSAYSLNGIDGVGITFIHLNDCLDWSLNKIADALEGKDV